MIMYPIGVTMFSKSKRAGQAGRATKTAGFTVHYTMV